MSESNKAGEGAPVKLAEAGSGFQKVDPWFDIVRTEHAVLDFWKASDAFNKLREKNRGNETFSFLDGPITANNPMGVHHAWGRTLKDAFQRYHAMNGKDLRYQNGFDCQGLWVEVEVEKEFGLNSKADVEAFGIDKFVEACKARVKKYSGVQTDQSIRLGMWMDWDNSYFTMAEENNYTIWHFLKKCHQRGKIYRGTDVMPWSGRTGAAYSQMEVVEGRRLVAHTAVFVRFPLKERENENLLIWTTTPWTLTSNVAAMINTELEYVKIRAKKDGQAYWFAKENLNFQRLERQFKEKGSWVDGVPKLKTIAQIFNERGGFEIEDTVKGEELVGLTYRGPFDELEAQSIKGGYPFEDPRVSISSQEAHKVIDAGRDSHGSPVVVAGEGTGIVHSAPGCGDIDHVIGEKLGLPKVAPLDQAANFLDKFGPLSGKNAVAKETVAEILDNLREKDLLVATEQYPHVYPHCWRTGDELVFRLVDEWYINMDWRDEIKKVVGDIQWIPEWGKDRELEWLTNMRDWMISKKRYWGLALPVWLCEACEHFDVIGGYEELKERAIEGWDKFEGHTPHRPYIDHVKIACPECGGKAHRVKDVGNPWLDAGIVPYSTTQYNTDREYWKKWMPADLVLESFPGQFRNWFYSLLAMSTMMEQMKPFETLVGHALVRDETGKEMHKSTGNAIWFDDAADQAGADVMRWLYAGQEVTSNLNFGFGPLREVRGKFINTLWNTYSFLVNYARLSNFKPGAVDCAFGDRPDFDRWILSELQDTITTARTAIESYSMRGATRAIEKFVDNLSGWYIRHNRRRFWKSEDSKDLHVALDTLYQCVYGVCRLVAPMMPFVSEAMYQNLVRSIDDDAPQSVHHTDYPQFDESLVDRSLTDDMRAIMKLNSLALSAREAKKIKVRQPLSRMVVGPGDKVTLSAAKRFSAMLRDDLNVKTVEVLETGSKSPLTYQLKPNFKRLGSRLGKQMKPAAQAIAQKSDELLAAIDRGDVEFQIEVEGETITLAKDDFQILSQSPEGQTVAEDRGSWVAFDTELTEDLIIEGLMRDVLRNLQDLRKKIGLEIEDRIRLRWNSEAEQIKKVFANWSDFIGEELLCVELSESEELEQATHIKLAKQTLSISIEKA